ncbi:hypothetical protein S7711_04890 [Stachybotrys chartarum IBT 7711]|uniref:Uncharacterized protein n=1 Tax=Stachybotrys chartarum (strain CBS 109288 / IBT 7711) TaxID=1280523 RepID=A0A084B6G2_STACB|nr:hypothetical protein S7711_04890 [Stachybotrys chartarum IBT 7711]
MPEDQRLSQRGPEPYYNLGTYGRVISSGVDDAQVWFNRGLVWCYAFNHEEAVKCFSQALEADPDCAMACWGIAYALGPNYNKPWDLFESKERLTAVDRTHASVKEAQLRSGNALPVEAALIAALTHRYPVLDAPPTKPECSIWNREYADAMASVFENFPDDLDVAALYADAMMNLTPWQLWDTSTGEPATGARTLEIKRVLDHAMELPGGDEHPGVLHMYIHLMEMSYNPEQAMPAANILRDLVPEAGHLNHMPSHLDILLGDYVRAVEANTKAIRADEKYLAREGPLNFYTLYRCHNYHFRLYAALFSGQSEVALETVDLLETTITDELLRIEQPPMADWLESFFAMRVHTLIRFGRWEEIVKLEMPRAEDRDLYCVTTTFFHYGKGMAFAALGRIDEAERQRQMFRKAVPNVKPTRTLFNNKCVDILCVAEALLDGEIEYRTGNYEVAFAHLQTSIERYDHLPFDEPWGWMQPTRHAYGALLLEQGFVEEAFAVYKADLGLDETLPRTHRHPKNVWALHGYHECLLKLGRAAEAKAIEPTLEEALAIADVPIRSSCFCRLKTASKTARL